MNKYASGYALLKFMSTLGSIVIGISIFGGFIFFFSSENVMGWASFVVAIAGGIQGLILMGVASIGEAILDGSLAQQKIAGSSDYRAPASTQNVQSASTPPNYVRVKNYKGHVILKGPSGIAIAGHDGQFKNVIEAERRIEEILGES
jgi:hypothetical protein